MKKILIFFCCLSLIFNLYTFSQYTKYKSQFEASYHLKINRGYFYGIHKSISEIDQLLEQIDRNEMSGELGITKCNLATCFKVAEESFSIMSPEMDLQNFQGSRYNDYMKWFYDELYNYTLGLTKNKNGIDKSKLIIELTAMKNGLKYIQKNITENFLKENNPTIIQRKWDEIIKKVFSDNPYQPAFQKYKQNYYRL